MQNIRDVTMVLLAIIYAIYYQIHLVELWPMDLQPSIYKLIKNMSMGLWTLLGKKVVCLIPSVSFFMFGTLTPLYCNSYFTKCIITFGVKVFLGSWACLGTCQSFRSSRWASCIIRFSGKEKHFDGRPVPSVSDSGVVAICS